MSANRGPNTQPKVAKTPELTDPRWSDPYAIFGFTRGTPVPPEDELKKKLRTFVKRYHPDVIQHEDPEKQKELRVIAEEKLKRVTLAYDLLRDEDKRKAYDQGRVDLFGSKVTAPPPPRYTHTPPRSAGSPKPKKEESASPQEYVLEVTKLFYTFSFQLPMLLRSMEGVSAQQLHSNVENVRMGYTRLLSFANTLATLRGTTTDRATHILIESTEKKIMESAQMITETLGYALRACTPKTAFEIFMSATKNLPPVSSVVAVGIIEDLDDGFFEAFKKSVKKASKKELGDAESFLKQHPARTGMAIVLFGTCLEEVEKQKKKKWF